jgi:hypothetical protein
MLIAIYFGILTILHRHSSFFIPNQIYKFINPVSMEVDTLGLPGFLFPPEPAPTSPVLIILLYLSSLRTTTQNDHSSTTSSSTTSRVTDGGVHCGGVRGVRIR